MQPFWKEHGLTKGYNRSLILYSMFHTLFMCRVPVKPIAFAFCDFLISFVKVFVYFIILVYSRYVSESIGDAKSNQNKTRKKWLQTFFEL